ncbi:MAG TPA: hypothetical protein VNN10_10690 [Dehalococcoidia bacterium]|nr:hypothetical protein [Dehalococcoidia bacterium]
MAPAPQEEAKPEAAPLAYEGLGHLVAASSSGDGGSPPGVGRRAGGPHTNMRLLNSALAMQSTARISREDTKKTGLDRVKEILYEPRTINWVGPLEEYELEDLWTELGPDVAKANPKEFQLSIARGMEPDNLEGPFGADLTMEKFQQAVEGLRDEYLEGNLKDIAKEEERLGINDAKQTPEQQAALTDVIILAEKAKQLDEEVKKLGSIQVGYNLELVPSSERDPDTPHAMELGEVPAYFRPGSPPEKPLKGTEGKGASTYEEVMAKYAEGMGALMAIANKHPSIYVGLKQGKLDAITGQSEDACTDPISGIKMLLGDAKKAIEETKADPPDWDELKPIHAQLLRGEHTAGGIPFNEIWYKEIIKDELGDIETQEMMIDLGIGLAAAVAFIFSEVATGGMATVLWAGAGLGIGAANVARKWDNYDELKNAAAAGTSQATELVEGGQVNAALVDAIIESVFFFLDAVGVAVKGVKGVAALGVKKAGKEAAEKAAGAAALKGLKSMSAEEAEKAISKAVDELGVEKAMQTAGVDSVDDLLAKVPADSAAAAKLKAFKELAEKGVEPAKLSEALKTALSGGKVTGKTGAELTLEDVVKQAIDTMGYQATLKEAGGWKKLGGALGTSSEAGKRLKAWRDGINADLKNFIEGLREPADGTGPLVQETGTLKDVTNDLDISFLGAKAGERREAAAQFLAGRTGLGSDPKILDEMLQIGLFTDPRRMHLFDEFPELQAKLADKTAKFQESLIWNNELHQYLVKAADGDKAAKAMADKIMAEMEALGVEKISGFKPMSERVASTLAKDQDRIHAAIEAAKNSGDMGKVESLIEELANIQAQINVKEGGGYFSSGGVRKFVTEKEGFPGARAAMTAAEDLTAALDQVKKLRDAVGKFEALAPVGASDPGKLAATIKDIAKYGDRFASASSVPGVKLPDASMLPKLADEFSQILLQARGESVHTMKQLLSKNMEGVIAKTRGAIAQFDEAHLAIIQALQSRAGIQGMEDLSADIIRATKARYAFVIFRNSLVMQMGTAARAAGLLIDLTSVEPEAGAEEEAPEEAPKGDFPVPKADTVPV